MMDDLIRRQDAIDALESIGSLDTDADRDYARSIFNAVPSAQPEHKTEKALHLLLEWAIECGFGYDNIPEEYERYKNDIEGMSYTDGLIYIAKMEVVE